MCAPYAASMESLCLVSPATSDVSIVTTVGKRILGIPASGGVRSGRARIVADASARSSFRPGDVLVVTTASPVYSPILAQAGALVTDIGGSLSSLATLARELGLPAVVATGVGTELIRDGDFVTVDGTRGIVRIAG